MNETHVAVFGATGNIGRDLIALLSQAKIPTLALTRDLGKAAELPFVEWMKADMGDPESLIRPLALSEVVFLLSGASSDFVREQGNVIRVARQQGVRHVVKLSSGAADKNSPYFIPRIHGEVESLLKSSGMGWTLLQPNGIMQNWLMDTADTVRRERKIYEATGDGKRSHVDRRDVAEVAFHCLTKSREHLDRTYFLTSDKAVGYAEIAEAIGNSIQETVTFVSLSLDEARLQMQQAGMPSFLVDTFIAYDEAQRAGKTDSVTRHVSTILGRPARTVEQFARDYADQFR